MTTLRTLRMQVSFYNLTIFSCARIFRTKQANVISPSENNSAEKAQAKQDTQKLVLSIVAVGVGLALAIAIGGAIAYAVYKPAVAAATAEAASAAAASETSVASSASSTSKSSASTASTSESASTRACRPFSSHLYRSA